MKREFEENKKNLLKKNLNMQDEIDDESFRKILKEEFIEREKQIEEALFADRDVEDLVFTREEIQDSYQELMRRFEKEKKINTEISEELVPDENLVRRVVSERKSGVSDVHENKDTNADRDVPVTEKKKVLLMEEVRERRRKSAESRESGNLDSGITEIRSRRTGSQLHRLGKVVGMTVVAVACIFAASMTSEANRKYLVNSVRIWSGDDTKTVVYNDATNENANADEGKAIEDIEEKLGVEVPEFYYRPYEMEFENYEIKELLEVARIEYKYKNNIIMLYIDKQNENSESKINSIHGDTSGTIILNDEGIEISISKIEDTEEQENYSAEWTRDSVTYCLSGRINIEDLKKIIKEMKF